MLLSSEKATKSPTKAEQKHPTIIPTISRVVTLRTRAENSSISAITAKAPDNAPKNRIQGLVT